MRGLLFVSAKRCPFWPWRPDPCQFPFKCRVRGKLYCLTLLPPREGSRMVARTPSNKSPRGLPCHKGQPVYWTVSTFVARSVVHSLPSLSARIKNDNGKNVGDFPQKLWAQAWRGQYVLIRLTNLILLFCSSVASVFSYRFYRLRRGAVPARLIHCWSKRNDCYKSIKWGAVNTPRLVISTSFSLPPTERRSPTWTHTSVCIHIGMSGRVWEHSIQILPTSSLERTPLRQQL